MSGGGCPVADSVSLLDCSSDSSQSIQSFAPSPIISSTLYPLSDKPDLCPRMPGFRFGDSGGFSAQ